MIVLICLVVFLLVLLGLWLWYHPDYFFLPFNCFYWLDGVARPNFYSPEELDRIFPDHILLEQSWEEIRDEGRRLYECLENPRNHLDNYNIDFDRLNTSNWTTIPLKLFTGESAETIAKCPVLGQFMLDHPEIVSCLFSVITPGKIIHPHVLPYDGLLRYQLALDIPVPEDGEECYLHVADEKYTWTNGKGILFDEGKIHGAVNTTKKTRMVLLLDIARPYHFAPFRGFNRLLLAIIGKLPPTTQALLT